MADLSDLAETLLGYLKTLDKPQSTADIASALGYPGPRNISPTLHKLVRQNLVVKVSDEPLWCLASSDGDTISHCDTDKNYADDVLNTSKEHKASLGETSKLKQDYDDHQNITSSEVKVEDNIQESLPSTCGNTQVTFGQEPHDLTHTPDSLVSAIDDPAILDAGPIVSALQIKPERLTPFKRKSMESEIYDIDILHGCQKMRLDQENPEVSHVVDDIVERAFADIYAKHEPLEVKQQAIDSKPQDGSDISHEDEVDTENIKMEIITEKMETCDNIPGEIYSCEDTIAQDGSLPSKDRTDVSLDDLGISVKITPSSNMGMDELDNSSQNDSSGIADNRAQSAAPYSNEDQMEVEDENWGDDLNVDDKNLTSSDSHPVDNTTTVEFLQKPFSYGHDNQRGPANFTLKNQIEERIIAYLKTRSKHTDELGRILKHLGCKSKKEVNKTLYNLQGRGILQKVQDVPPKWTVCHPNISVYVPLISQNTGDHAVSVNRGQAPIRGIPLTPQEILQGKGKNSSGNSTVPLSQTPRQTIPQNQETRQGVSSRTNFQSPAPQNISDSSNPVAKTEQSRNKGALPLGRGRGRGNALFNALNTFEKAPINPGVSGNLQSFCDNRTAQTGTFNTKSQGRGRPVQGGAAFVMNHGPPRSPADLIKNVAVFSASAPKSRPKPLPNSSRSIFDPPIKPPPSEINQTPGYGFGKAPGSYKDSKSEDLVTKPNQTTSYVVHQTPGYEFGKAPGSYPSSNSPGVTDHSTCNQIPSLMSVTIEHRGAMSGSYPSNQVSQSQVPGPSLAPSEPRIVNIGPKTSLPPTQTSTTTQIPPPILKRSVTPRTVNASGFSPKPFSVPITSLASSDGHCTIIPDASSTISPNLMSDEPEDTIRDSSDPSQQALLSAILKPTPPTGGGRAVNASSFNPSIPPSPASILGLSQSRHQSIVTSTKELRASAAPAPSLGLITGTSSSSNITNDAFAALNKNSISALMEYAQARKATATFEVLSQWGPPHRPKFKVAAFVGSRQFPPVECTSKKDGRKEAADVALRTLMAEGQYKAEHQEKQLQQNSLMTLGVKATHFDKIAGLAHAMFNQLAAHVMESMSGRKVLAALIMQKGAGDQGTVISMGTGNRCITGNYMSLEGQTVNDSHAEIITRRGFIRFLYKQLMDYQPGSVDSILEKGQHGKLKVKDSVTFHLYISTAPCGDGALFSPRDCHSAEMIYEDGPQKHEPIFSSKVQGVLRTKMEGGEGTIPIESGFKAQTFDGIQRGERLRTMSCSDKLCRWNIVGMQGALLTHFMEPVYMASLTLGLLYDHGHLSRAVCCRLSHGEPDISMDLPPTFKINHPCLGRVTVCQPPRETQKTKEFSVNWSLGDTKPEVLDGTKGICVGIRSLDEQVSRTAKCVLYNHFKDLCQKYSRQDLMSAQTYGEAKKMAIDFQSTKQRMLQKFRVKGYGPWVGKPVEEEMFM